MGESSEPLHVFGAHPWAWGSPAAYTNPRAALLELFPPEWAIFSPLPIPLPQPYSSCHGPTNLLCGPAIPHP